MSLVINTKRVIKAVSFVIILIFTSYAINVESYSQSTFLKTSVNADLPLDFNATYAFNHISTQLDFGFRVPGTTDHVNCSEWIGNQVSSSVDEVIRHNFTIQKESQPSYNCQNILGKLNTDKKNIVILASHWDSRNVAEKDYVNQSLPIPGANDGASSVGVLLEMARVLNLYKEFLDCEVWFLFLDAEDQGSSGGMYGLEGWDWAEGAKEFAENIDDFYSSTEEIECFILLDMVGGFDLEFVQESRNDANLQEAIFSIGQLLGYSVAFPDDPKEMSITDDHVAFDEIGIPVIDLIIDFVASNWTYHHTHSDDLSNIDIESLKITGQAIEAFIKTYYAEGDNLEWNGGAFSNTFLILSVSVFVIVAVFTVNFLITKRKKS
ncbi:MAG: M28 family peptidase [Candidatus Heimdallarchaeota archaeon]|nr:M28 family peptidase [Candidatus Heimdallarchaeota archaeon]